MIENFPVKIDTVGRIVVPKKVRDKLNFKEGSRFYIKEEKQYILFEQIEQIESIDHFGRVLVPKRIREKHNITNKSIILLSTTENGFKIKSNISKYQELISKLIFLENNYDIGIILTNNTNIIHVSKGYKETINKTLDIDDYLKDKKESFLKKIIRADNSEILHLYMIDKTNDKKLLTLIYALI